MTDEQLQNGIVLRDRIKAPWKKCKQQPKLLLRKTVTP